MPKKNPIVDEIVLSTVAKIYNYITDREFTEHPFDVGKLDAFDRILDIIEDAGDMRPVLISIQQFMMNDADKLSDNEGYVEGYASGLDMVFNFAIESEEEVLQDFSNMLGLNVEDATNNECDRKEQFERLLESLKIQTQNIFKL